VTPRGTIGAAPLSERLRWGVRLTAQGLRRHRALFWMSAAAFACATVALAACLALARAPSAIVATTGSAQLVAFLNDDLPAGDRDALAVVLRKLPGVAGVRVLPSNEALVRMRAELGARAALLDGVEDGFLPTTLEIALRPGREGTGRADELAWRLRRMAGISDVDVLRNEADHRLVTEQETGRRLRVALVAASGLLALAALMLVAALARRRRADASILEGLGFTAWAVSGPVFVAGAAAGAGGVSVVLLALRIVERLGSVPAFAAVGAAASRGLGGGRGQAAAILAATLLGGAVAWWGMRVNGQPERDDQLATDV
jgi:cell division protein FtsX